MSSVPHRPPRIDAERLHASLRELAEIGATAGGGVTRLALSDEDRAGRDLLKAWMQDVGLAVRVDDLGTITGRRAGTDDAPALLIGSHIDSVRNGGRYDGAYGVLGGLEVIRTLTDQAITTRRPIELVSWTNEEGVRFEPAMMASGTFAGRFDQSYVYDRRDRDGYRFEDELRRIGYLGLEVNRPGPASAYVELHIEQGPVLEDAGVPVGIVEGIVGITWSEVIIEGRADHAGPSPMPLRRDALAAAAQVVAGIERLARETEGAVGTVGRIAAEPNTINTIPGRVVLSADLRHYDPGGLEDLVARLQSLTEELARERSVEIALQRFWTSEPTPFDPEIVATVQAAAAELGLASRRLWSGAGHDAKYLQAVCPSAMIFVRSRDGLSHSEAEYSAPDDLEAGANVLLRTALKLAGT